MSVSFCAVVVGVNVVVHNVVGKLFDSVVLVVHSSKHGESAVANLHFRITICASPGQSVSEALAGSGGAWSYVSGNGVLEASEGAFVNVTCFACIKCLG